MAKFDEDRSGVIDLNEFRRHLFASSREEALRNRNAAVKIQALHRGRMARRRAAQLSDARRELLAQILREGAATRIQSLFRGGIARKETARLRKEAEIAREHAAAVKIQCMW